MVPLEKRKNYQQFVEKKEGVNYYKERFQIVKKESEEAIFKF
jgi:hypothetical protein